MSLRERIETTTPGGKLVFYVFGAVMEFESGQIRERTMAWLQAKARGRYGGRPRTLDEDTSLLGGSRTRESSRWKRSTRCLGWERALYMSIWLRPRMMARFEDEPR